MFSHARTFSVSPYLYSEKQHMRLLSFTVTYRTIQFVNMKKKHLGLSDTSPTFKSKILHSTQS